MERIARVAFDAAMKRGKRLCSVEKSNVLEVGSVQAMLPSRQCAAGPHPQVQAACNWGALANLRTASFCGRQPAVGQLNHTSHPCMVAWFFLACRSASCGRMW